MFNPSGIKAKIVSVIEEETGQKELEIDSRPFNSTSPINLELSIHKQNANVGDPLTISSYNELWCSLPFAQSYGWDFGKKPITLWERSIIDPNRNPNDPNNYTISFMADIRDANDKSDFYIPGSAGKMIKTSRLILPHLDGIHGSEIPYMYAQTRFNTFPGDFDLHGRVDMQDFAYLAEDWGLTNGNSLADISGLNGLPDGNVDVYDLALFTRDYLKDSNDPNTW